MPRILNSVNIIKIITIFQFLVYVIGCSLKEPARIMVLSLSSDGKYAISSSSDNKILFWDINHKVVKLISKNANIYSAYFIKNSFNFMWQDLKDIVHIQDIYGSEVMQFKYLPTYGHAITSDLEHYFASDENWNLYSGFNKSIIKHADNTATFWSTGKLFNLIISNNEKMLLTIGFGYKPDTFINPKNLTKESELSGITLWKIKDKKPFKLFNNNIAKTTATLSNDDSFLISGDENGLGFVWNIKYSHIQDVLTSIYHNRLINPPLDFTNIYNGNLASPAVYSIKFIDAEGHYLRFNTYTPYAILMKINNRDPIKYLLLGRKPLLCINEYVRNIAIDTSPISRTLVMAFDVTNNIIAFNFDPKKLLLNKFWISHTSY